MVTTLSPGGDALDRLLALSKARTAELRRQVLAARKNRRERVLAARERGTHTPEEWQALLAFCGNACLACDALAIPGRFPIEKDHILPISLGGSDAIENIQPLCHRCNNSKGNRGERRDLRPAGWREAQP